MMDWTSLPTIDAVRICLRGLTDRDVDALFGIFSDPEVMRYWSSPALPDRAAARRLLEEIHDGFNRRAFCQWGIALRRDDTIIGTATLFHIDTVNRRAELGYALGRSNWGKGYMQEALGALFEYAFGEMNLHRLEADVDPRNATSIRTLERLGFQREGYLRERWLAKGEAQDSVLYGLLSREWRRLKGQ
jgi:RimJ/RimL family protein N-acetyltransferase